jgi:uncharacterized protein YqeY
MENDIVQLLHGDTLVDKADNLRITARQHGDSNLSALMSLLVSDARKLAKDAIVEVTDSHITQAAKSLVKKNNEALNIVANKVDSEAKQQYSNQLLRENLILHNFIPQALSDDVVEDIIRTELKFDMTTAGLSIGKIKGTVIKALKDYVNTHSLNIDFSKVPALVDKVISSYVE